MGWARQLIYQDIYYLYSLDQRKSSPNKDICRKMSGNPVKLETTEETRKVSFF